MAGPVTIDAARLEETLLQRLLLEALEHGADLLLEDLVEGLFVQLPSAVLPTAPGEHRLVEQSKTPRTNNAQDEQSRNLLNKGSIEGSALG